MSESELRQHLSELRELSSIPATRSALIKAESEVIKTRKPRPRKSGNLQEHLSEI